MKIGKPIMMVRLEEKVVKYGVTYSRALILDAKGNIQPVRFAEGDPREEAERNARGFSENNTDALIMISAGVIYKWSGK